MAKGWRSMLQSAERLAARGKFDAAIAEYKKALKVQPEDTGVLNRLGDLYARLDQVDKAVEIFSQTAQHFVREGFFVKAIAIYKKIIRIEPTHIDTYEVLADLYQRQGLRSEALTQYQVVADYYQQGGDKEKVREIYEHMVAVEGDNPGHRVRLAELYVDAGLLQEATSQYQIIAAFMLDHKKEQEALRVYKGAFDLNPYDLEFLTDATLNLVENDAREAAESLMEHAVRRNPEAAKIREVTGLVETATTTEAIEGAGEAADDEHEISEERTAVVDLDGAEELEELDLPGLESEAAAAGAVEELEVSREPTAELEIELEDLESEETAASLVEQEADTLPGVAEVVPDEDDGEATTDLLTEAQALVSYGLDEKAEVLCAEIVAEDPDNAEARVLLFEIYHRLERWPDAVAAATGVRRAAHASARRDLWNEFQLTLLEHGYGLFADRIVAPAEQETKPEAIPEPTDTVVFEMEDFEPPVTGEGGGGVPAAEDAAAATAASDAEELAWLADGHAEDGDLAAEESLFGAEDEFFDLAAELEQELADEEGDGDAEILPQIREQSIEEIVEGFRQGVAENLSEEDYDTHFNLGIAYREMGLVDEAIGEFQLAAKSPRYLVDCCALLGACFLEKGYPNLAIKWFERGLQADGITESETLGLLYELGNLYATTGDKDVAREKFEEIYGANSNYRDVVAKLAELTEA